MALTQADREWFEAQLSKLHTRATENATNIAEINGRLSVTTFVSVRECSARHSKLARTVGIGIGIWVVLSVVGPVLLGVYLSSGR